ncbi:MAG: hypothetical protein JWQ87_978 [Candidatus Sulfotelmatobacter sp.]|nr:hypothetical protein [Candidatus Sulfotelmatobacter sp.]
MNDTLTKLRGLASQIKARDEELRAHFEELESLLNEASAGCKVRGHSESCKLETYGDDEAYYGSLLFDDTLQVLYRTTEADLIDRFDDEHFEPTYSVSSLDKCSSEWLRALAAPRVIESLLTSITSGLQASVTSAAEGIRALSTTTNLPLRGLDAGLVDVATKLKYGDVIQQWQEAQSALGVDPPDASTRASRLIETVCKHILQTKNAPLPNKESIQPLYRAASQALTLGPEQQSSEDLRAMGSGMITVISSIGAFRTHAGTAHGTAPADQPVNFSQARLAVNAAGVLATFLMDAMLHQTGPGQQHSKP